jgi:amino acid transporter
MMTLLLTMFAGIVLLTWLDGVVPSPSQTVLSQLARRELGHGVLYGSAQAALVLLLAANTAFNDFPRLLFFLARDNVAPRMFMHMGDRLAFSYGISFLGAFAAVIYAAPGGSVGRLIPLYAVGVFLAFTLSQAGMVVHWWRGREPGWRASIIFNVAGAIASGVVLAVHIAPDEDEGSRFGSYWHAWGDQLPLEVVVSPYRALVAPLTAYVRELHEQRPDLTITVVVPQVVAKRRWQRLLHSNVGSRLGRALRPLPGIVITSVPFHLPT